MDSMRSLNTSLPTALPDKQRSYPPEQLHQAFKSAALSVTNLYRAAASEREQARSAGYRDALEDLLGFIDQENLSMAEDGGWRLKQWATERAEGGVPVSTGTDSEEDVEEDKQARSPSPVHTRTRTDPATSPPRTCAVSSSSLPPDVEAPGPTETPSRPEQPDFSVPQAAEFAFRSSFRPSSSHELDADTIESRLTGEGSTAGSSWRRDNRTRHRRAAGRRNGNSPRSNARTASLPSLGTGAGLKRRMPFGEYFDIGSLTLGKEFGHSGSKKGRFT